MKFKIGDRVLCIKGHKGLMGLNEGEVYTVIKIHEDLKIQFFDRDEYFITVHHTTYEKQWMSTRFKLVGQLLPEELFEL